MVDLSNCYLHSLGKDEAKLLEDLRSRIPSLIARVRAESAEAAAMQKVTIWKQDIEVQSDASDMVLLKFIRAEELNVDKAAERIVQTLIFRAECKLDELAAAELPEHFRGHDYLSGLDTEGRPAIISRFGSMDLDKVFGDVEAFVRYRAQLMERLIAQMKWERGTPETLCQIHDYSGVPIMMTQNADVKGGVAAVSKIFSEHYPEFKGKTIFLNFPSVFVKMFKAFTAFLPDRTRQKFHILGDQDHATLFEVLPAQFVPEALGGMLQEPASALRGPCSVVLVKARATEEIVPVTVTAPGTTVLWELRVCHSEVAYQVVFAPSDGGAEEEVRKTEAKEYLQATDGIVTGQYDSKVAGCLKIRFINDGAWFKSRLCVCRAEVAQ